MPERLHFPPANKQKVPFVCFGCRVGLKKTIPFLLEECGDIPRPNQRPYVRNEIRCPRCEQPMAFVGRYFKIPARSDEKNWRKAEILWKSGWCADGHGGKIGPRTLCDARNYLSELPDATQKANARRRRRETQILWRRARNRCGKKS